jgi:hypothetical protein
MSPLELIKYPTDLIQRAVRAERLAAAKRDPELSKGWSSLATTYRIMARRRPDGGRTQIIDKRVM